jgi:hypothetical protein
VKARRRRRRIGYRSIGDSPTYVLAPDGAFSSSVAPGWQLRGGARIVSDPARGAGLALPAGASVVSPAVCIDLSEGLRQVALEA